MGHPASAAGRVTRSLVAVSASLALVVSVVGMASAVRWVQLRDIGTDSAFHRVTPSSSSAPSGGKCSDHPCNYLLLGSDSRTGLTPAEQQRFGTNANNGGQVRADTIMLVHTDPNLKKAIILSFP